MMILLDIDDTLLDHSGAERKAAAIFGGQHAASIPGYLADAFAEHWRFVAERHMVSFLAGEINFQEQRRRRMRDVFGNAELADAEADTLFAGYLRAYEDAWALFPDVLPFFERHGGGGVGIISDGAQQQQPEKLRRLGIHKFVRFIVTAESTGLRKPDAAMFHQACELAGVAPKDACYIGDNLQKDAQGASAAGLRGIWLDRSGKAVVAKDGVERIASLLEFA